MKNFFNNKIQFLVCLLIFILTAFSYGYAPSSPSDPTDYVESVIDDKVVFAYPDRLLLWIFLRLTNIFVSDPIYLSSISAILISIAFFIVAYIWLQLRFGSTASSFFSLLMISSPVWINISSYLFPVHGLAFCSLIVIIIIHDVKSSNLKYFLLGVLSAASVLFKIQGIAIIVYVIILSILEGEFKKIVYSLFGFLFLILLLLLLWLLIDDLMKLKQIYYYYFDSTVSAQWRGRALGGIPPYFAYLMTPSLLFPSVFLISTIIKLDIKSFEFKLSLLAVTQFLFLIFIYLITNRGGPVIGNYILDSTSGLIILFCVYIATRFDNFHIKVRNFFKLDVNHIILLFILLTIIFQFIAKGVVDNPTIFLANYKYDKYGQLNYVSAGVQLFSIYILLKLISLKAKKVQIFNHLFRVIMLFFLLGTIFLNSHVGILEAISRKNDSLRFYNLARLDVEDMRNGKINRLCENDDVMGISAQQYRRYMKLYFGVDDTSCEHN